MSQVLLGNGDADRAGQRAACEDLGKPLSLLGCPPTGNDGSVQTPATVFLESNNIAYRSLPYDHDPGAESYGLEAAQKLGLEPETVFKTLMARVDGDCGDLVVAIVPVTGQLNLKALARAADAKRAHMATISDAERSSGYVAGGISPFGQKRSLRTFVDETAEICDTMYVSGGQRGLDIGLSPGDLIAALDAIVAPLATD